MTEKHYRVWDKENKTMGYARDLLHVAGMFRELYDACEPGETFPDGYVLMEGIGLKDKNGKEIYGGDIVRNIGYLHPAEVIYEAPSFMVGENGMLRDIDLNLYDRLEVIGNIYENPNLLSQDK